MIRSALAASTLFLAACGVAETSAPETGSYLEATGAYVLDPAAGRDITGGGVTIKASGAMYTLVGARSDAAERVELHTMAMEDGVMKMRQVDSLEAAPDAPIVLERGGDHLMLFGFDDAVAPGDTIELFLDFTDENGEPVTLNVEADVRDLADG